MLNGNISLWACLLEHPQLCGVMWWSASTHHLYMPDLNHRSMVPASKNKRRSQPWPECSGSCSRKVLLSLTLSLLLKIKLLGNSSHLVIVTGSKWLEALRASVRSAAWYDQVQSLSEVLMRKNRNRRAMWGDIIIPVYSHFIFLNSFPSHNCFFLPIL